MNVPNLNFDAESGSARLPSTAAYGSRAVANAPYGEFINFDQGSTFDHRKAIFTYLGLALKYRWLILTFLHCRISHRVYRHFHINPNLSGDGQRSD